MNKDTLIFIGRSGSGKGTQVKLLKKYLEENHSGTDILHFESGAHFRSFTKETGYTNELMRNIVEKGLLAPDFITEWLFVKDLIKNLSPEKMLIIDGFPRTKNQAKTLGSVMNYYKRSKINVIHLNVSENEVKSRMLNRGRLDDKNTDGVNRRIEWYNQNVLPVLEYLENQNQYDVITIDGEMSAEKVHVSIIKSLNY